MPTVSTILQSQVDASDSSAETVSEAVKADGYYGNADGLHTVAYMCSADFVGTIKIQGSLATGPTSSDWFDVDSTSVGDGSSVVSTQYINFTGNFVWVRSVVTVTTGSVTKILLNF
jgi:hypothetical protein|tara:strand:+ start:2636 stop:2983 length:348 start_codon:yes stop_codon:yes gene_type:complete